MMNEPEKSEPSPVAAKPANKTGRSEAESVEPREGAKGNTPEPHTHRTRRSPLKSRIRQRFFPACRKHWRSPSRHRFKVRNPTRTRSRRRRCVMMRSPGLTCSAAIICDSHKHLQNREFEMAVSDSL
jgi:hypothetical protein